MRIEKLRMNLETLISTYEGGTLLLSKPSVQLNIFIGKVLPRNVFRVAAEMSVSRRFRVPWQYFVKGDAHHVTGYENQQQDGCGSFTARNRAAVLGRIHGNGSRPGIRNLARLFGEIQTGWSGAIARRSGDPVHAEHGQRRAIREEYDVERSHWARQSSHPFAGGFLGQVKDNKFTRQAFCRDFASLWEACFVSLGEVCQ